MRGVRPGAVAVLLASMSLMVACGGTPVSPTLADKNYDVNYWDIHKGTCETVLSNPCGVEEPELLRCTKLWEMYKETDGLDITTRSRFAKGFSQLYHTTQGYHQYIAMAALSRVGIRPHPMGSNNCIIEEVPLDMNWRMDPFSAAGQDMMRANANTNIGNPELEALLETRATVAVKTAKKGKVSAAKKANSKGLKKHKEGNYAAAISHYKAALKADPFFIHAKYNMSCAYALMGDGETSLKVLSEMYQWDSESVSERLVRARSDTDFASVRDDVRFKVMTGYVRLILMNGAGEAGAETMERLKTEIAAQGYAISRDGNDINPRLQPMIFYKTKYRAEAEELQAIVNSPETQMLSIDWDTLNDVIVVWGEPAAAELFAGSGMAPIVQGERVETVEEALTPEPPEAPDVGLP